MDLLLASLKKYPEFEAHHLELIHSLLHHSSIQIEEQALKSFFSKIENLNLPSEYYLVAILYLLFPDSTSDEPIIDSFAKLDSVVSKYQKLRQLLHLSFSLKNKEQIELSLKMILAIAKDWQLVSVLLAIRLQKMENIESMQESARPSFAQETLILFAPLADRLGIFGIKSELEDLSLRHIDSAMYYQMKKIVAKKRGERAKIVEQISTEIHTLMNEANIAHQVQGRYKRFYSIYQKLKKVNYDENRIQDLIAFRILTEKKSDCYTALSYIHERWEPKEGRYKDYITNPKPNGYQSLHTTVYTEDREIIEIQIRTYDMHKTAEYGIAAHWMYKETEPMSKKQNQTVHDLFKHVKNSPNQEDENFPILFNSIYVRTPKNDIIELPKEATPIDFAYSIHTQVGNQITGAKVNGKIIKLESPLNNGETIELLLSPKQKPRKEWLDFAKSAKVRNKIKRELNVVEREEKKKFGWEQLEKEFRKHELNLKRLSKEGKLEQKCLQMKQQSLDHVLLALGNETLKPQELIRWFIPFSAENHSSPKLQSQNFSEKTHRLHTISPSKVIVDGVSDVPTKLAKCCSPQFGEPITGYITDGAVTVHHQSCTQLLLQNTTKRVKVAWNMGHEEISTPDALKTSSSI